MSKREYVEMPGTQPLFRPWEIVEAVRAGNTVSVSGQVGWDEQGNPVEGLEAELFPKVGDEHLIRQRSSAPLQSLP